MDSHESLLARQQADVFSELLRSSRRLAWSADRLAAERTARLRALLQHAAARSAGWKERLGDLDPSTATEADLARLPVLTKTDLTADFDRLVTDPALTWDRVRTHAERHPDGTYLDGRFRLVASSGTGGTRTHHVYDWDEWVALAALTIRWRRSSGAPDGLMASLYADSPVHISGALHAFFAGAAAAPARLVHLPATLALPEIVGGLNTADPDRLQGYPSMVQLLALEAGAGRLRIRPRWVSTSGEQCTDAVRAAVRAAWQVDVYDVFGCSEGVYAFPCAPGRSMHLPDDLAIVEPVDHHDQPVPLGRPAHKLLVTSLYRRAQPLIRYELTDATTLSDEPCPCGCAHRRIVDLRGRSVGAFVYAGGRAVHCMSLATALLADPAVVEYQVRQTPRGALVTVATNGPCDTGALGAALALLMRRSGIPDPDVVVRVTDRLDRLWSGKLRQFEPLGTA